MTQTLVSLGTRYEAAAPADRALEAMEVRRTAADRHALLANLVEQAPAAMLRLALPDAARAGLPSVAQELIEHHATVEGRLEVRYVDYPDPRQSHSVYLFERDSGERYALAFSGKSPSLLSGTRLRAHGLLFPGIRTRDTGETDGTLVLDAGEAPLAMLADNDAASALLSASVPASAPLPNTFGEQKTLVLLVNFQDRPGDQPWTVIQANSVVFGTVSDFFRENSYGQTWLSGHAYGWYTLALDSSVCDSTQIAVKAQAAATAAGVDLSTYSRYVYVFPYISSCGWSGSGTVGGLPSQTWSNGKLDLKVIGHELGHNFGLQHAHALECGAATFGPGCQNYEYGDHFDIMGNYTAGQFNAFEKALLGWLGYGGSPPLTTVDTSGTYSLAPYETGITGPKALKVSKGVDAVTGARQWYYLEYRQSIGADSFLSGNANVPYGVLFHTGYEQDRNSGFTLDMTPGSFSYGYDDWEDPALVVGSGFYDPESGIQVTTASTDSGGASVDIDLGAAQCVRAAPVLSLSPAEGQWLAPGTPVTYTVGINNRDATACAASAFTLQGTVPAGWTLAFSNSVLNLVPGASGSASFQVISAVSAADGYHPVSVTVTNELAPVYTASGTVTYVVNTAAANHAPQAVDDSATTVEGTPVIVPVLANDTDPDGDPLIVSSVAQAANGKVSLNSNGTLTYLPNRRFRGSDAFTYRVSDGFATATATVSPAPKANRQADRPSMKGAYGGVGHPSPPGHSGQQASSVSGVTD